MAKKEQNGIHNIPLFNPTLLAELDFDNTSLKEKHGLTPSHAGDNLTLRPLNSDDFSRGYVTLLAQLTKVGDLTEEKYLERFDGMKSCSNSYYIVVVEDESVGQVIASGTLAVEQKFIHCAATRGRVEDIVVDTNYRGKRLGQLLLETLTRLSEKVGCYKTSLECKDHLIDFYKSFGYIKENGQNYLCKRFYH